jgi:predicted DNA-binding transcriptional regulator AlpA
MSEKTVAKEYRTRQEISAMISMSVPWIRKQERLGRFCARIPCGRSVRYDPETVRRWMAERATSVGTQSAA